MPAIINVAAYKFAELHDLPELRRDLRELCQQQQLLGTILLSREGINLFVAGARAGVDRLLERLRAIPDIGTLDVKESCSQTPPFNRMLVKIKREIIAFGVAGIEPWRYTSRRLTAPELKAWLDEGRAFTLLDTRNDFEVQAGTFKSAVAIGIEEFRDFPAAVERLPAAMKQQPVVTFCTGGIRCEKAAPYLEREGFQDVYQLDGGILKYLELCNNAHYEGECFVFDHRVAVDATLSAGALKQCFVCQAILSPADQQSAAYVEGQSCPRCHQTVAEIQANTLHKRREALHRATHPLPGSAPYENVRPISVPARLDGLELMAFLEAMQTHLSLDEWRRACDDGRLLCRGERVSPGRVMRAGERLLHVMPATREPDVAADIEILFEDAAIIVVNKPAPLPMHPCGRYNRNTLGYILDQVYHPLHPRPAHRLDADTSGLVIFSKTRAVARNLQPQFETGSVKKVYLALVHGQPANDQFDCHLPMATAAGPGGMRLPTTDGAPASTRFHVLQRGNHTSLLEVAPQSGRTHQIRAHLWQLGMPIVGDPIFLPGHQTGTAKTLALGDPPLCLQASALNLLHPSTRQPLHFAAPAPAWATMTR